MSHLQLPPLGHVPSFDWPEGRAGGGMSGRMLGSVPSTASICWVLAELKLYRVPAFGSAGAIAGQNASAAIGGLVLKTASSVPASLLPAVPTTRGGSPPRRSLRDLTCERPRA